MGNFGTNRKAALLRRKRERSFHWAFYLSIPLPFPSLNATCRVQCASPYLPLGEWTQGVQVLCAGKTSQNNVDHLGEQAGEQKVAFLHPHRLLDFPHEIFRILTRQYLLIAVSFEHLRIFQVLFDYLQFSTNGLLNRYMEVKGLTSFHFESGEARVY